MAVRPGPVETGLWRRWVLRCTEKRKWVGPQGFEGEDGITMNWLSRTISWSLGLDWAPGLSARNLGYRRGAEAVSH